MNKKDKEADKKKKKEEKQKKAKQQKTEKKKKNRKSTTKKTTTNTVTTMQSYRKSQYLLPHALVGLACPEPGAPLGDRGRLVAPGADDSCNTIPALSYICGCPAPCCIFLLGIPPFEAEGGLGKYHKISVTDVKGG